MRTLFVVPPFVHSEFHLGIRKVVKNLDFQAFCPEPGIEALDEPVLPGRTRLGLMVLCNLVESDIVRRTGCADAWGPAGPKNVFLHNTITYTSHPEKFSARIADQIRSGILAIANGSASEITHQVDLVIAELYRLAGDATRSNKQFRKCLNEVVDAHRLLVEDDSSEIREKLEWALQALYRLLR